MVLRGAIGNGVEDRVVLGDIIGMDMASVQEAEMRSRAGAFGGARQNDLCRRRERAADVQLAATASGGYGIDALWNDDFHHCAMVAITGRDEAYHTDYAGTAREFLARPNGATCIRASGIRGRSKPRGTPSLICHRGNFVNFLENHDQVANSGPRRPAS